MPACLDSYPWQSLKGCGSMAPAMFKVGDYKNACLKDGTNVQFRIIGFNHDRARGGIVVPMNTSSRKSRKTASILLGAVLSALQLHICWPEPA